MPAVAAIQCQISICAAPASKLARRDIAIVRCVAPLVLSHDRSKRGRISEYLVIRVYSISLQ